MSTSDKALGRSFVATQGTVAKYTVELARFGVPPGGVHGAEAISLVYNALEPRVRMADLDDASVSIGKIVTNQAQSECGLYVDLTSTEGAAVTATAPKFLATEVKLVVARSSPWLRRIMWTVLAVACIGGVVLMKQLDLDWDPRLDLAVGLLAGCAVAVAALAGVTRTQLLAGGRSAELTEKLDAVVRAWVDSDPANAKPKRKKRTRPKKREKKAPSEDDA